MNKLYEAFPSLYQPKVTDEQWGMSYANPYAKISVPMSIPEIHPVDVDTVSTQRSSFSSVPDTDAFITALSAANVFKPQPVGGGVSSDEANANLTSFREETKEKATKMKKAGHTMKLISAAGDVFSHLLLDGTEWEGLHETAENKKVNIANQMSSLDNQVLFYKNQVANKFGELMARNAVTMAAKNLRVTAGNLLEQTKGAAIEATEDIKMKESNARLKKIALESEARQADVAKKLQKSLMITDLIEDTVKLGAYVYGAYEDGLFSSTDTAKGKLTSN